MTKITWPQGFDPAHPTARQIQMVEAAIARLIGHPIMQGTGLAMTRVIMLGLRNATEMDADAAHNIEVAA
jgi:hypothetical protein